MTNEKETANLEIIITSARIKDDNNCVFSYENRMDARTDKVKGYEPDIPIHQDLRDAFGFLVPHLLFMVDMEKENAAVLRQYIIFNNTKISAALDLTEDSELITSEIPEDPERDELNWRPNQYSCNSFFVKDDTVSITGSKRLNNGKVATITTPPYKLDGDDYPFGELLYNAVLLCQVEVHKYLDGKRAPNDQMDLFDSKAMAKSNKRGKSIVETAFGALADKADSIEFHAEGEEPVIIKGKGRSKKAV